MCFRMASEVSFAVAMFVVDVRSGYRVILDAVRMCKSFANSYAVADFASDSAFAYATNAL